MLVNDLALLLDLFGNSEETKLLICKAIFVWCLQRHRHGGLNSGLKSAIIVTDALPITINNKFTNLLMIINNTITNFSMTINNIYLHIYQQLQITTITNLSNIMNIRIINSTIILTTLLTLLEKQYVHPNL